MLLDSLVLFLFELGFRSVLIFTSPSQRRGKGGREFIWLHLN